VTARWTISAVAGYGIELEYAIVDRESLVVRPIADRLLAAFAGREAATAERGSHGWSNELAGQCDRAEESRADTGAGRIAGAKSGGT
jgi:hypothetical protein